MITAPTATPAPMVAEKKPFHKVADAYIGCLLGEINAYQVREKAYATLTNCVIPDRDLKAAKGATNTQQEIYRKALAEERDEK